MKINWLAFLSVIALVTLIGISLVAFVLLDTAAALIIAAIVGAGVAITTASLSHHWN